MNSADLNPCPYCDSGLAPTMADSANCESRFSFAFWVVCPMCELSGPKTWITLEQAELAREFAAGQAEAARVWNRLTASVRGMRELSSALLGEVEP